MFLPDDLFKTVIDNTPLVAIDLVFERDGHILVGKRTNKPAKDFLFAPGGRIQKNERLCDAFFRISKMEIGTGLEYNPNNLLGVYEHFYEDAIYDGVTTHYVVLAFHIKDWYGEPVCDNQHEQFMWLNMEDADERVHEYTRLYIEGIKKINGLLF